MTDNITPELAAKATPQQVLSAAEERLADLLDDFRKKIYGKEGEELVGMCNFYWMEIVQLIRNVQKHALLSRESGEGISQ